MNDRQERMYNKYIRGQITLKELLKWNDEYKERKDKKHVA